MGADRIRSRWSSSASSCRWARRRRRAPQRRTAATLRTCAAGSSRSRRSRTAEMLEPSLGGADSAARVRQMSAASRSATVQASDCAAAFAEVLEDLGNGDTATYDPATCELRSGRAPADDVPRATAGRVRRVRALTRRSLSCSARATRCGSCSPAPDRYVWAFDNGAPLYRVRLVLDGTGGARVDLLTPPKDIVSLPAAEHGGRVPALGSAARQRAGPRRRADREERARGRARRIPRRSGRAIRPGDAILPRPALLPVRPQFWRRP